MGCCEVSSGCRGSPQCALCVLTSAGRMGACELYVEDEQGTQYNYWEIYLILPNFWNLGAQSSFYFKMRFLSKTDGEIGLITESKRYDLILILGCMKAWILELPPMFNGLRKSIRFLKKESV